MLTPDCRSSVISRLAGGLLLAALLLLLSAGSRAHAAAISFLPPVSYDKPAAADLTAADVDGDGKLDIVVVGGGSVSVFYGNGDGTFQPRVDYPVGDGLAEVIAADVNGDGQVDLVIDDDSTNTVDVLINQGNRQFAAPVRYPVGAKPYGVVAGDFNGDGHLDLAVSNDNSDNLFVYFGDGQGGFTVGGSYGVGSYPARIVTDDFNGDGIPDLATANTFSNSISILLGDGNRGFSTAGTYPTIQYPHIMASADLDDDGAPDLVAPNNGTSFFTLLQNKGDGSFMPAVTIPSGGSNTRTLTVGDFNGDGLPDVAVGNESSNNVTIFLNNTPLPTPAIRSLTLDKTAPVGGLQSLNGTVTLTAPAPAGGAAVIFATNNPALTVPLTVTVPEGLTSAGVTILTATVATPARGTVTASYNGTAKRLAITVRPVGLHLLTLAPNPVTGGQSATAQLTLDAPAGPGGTSVALSSSQPLIAPVPPSVTVPAGATGATFTVPTIPVAAATPVTIGAAIPGSSVAALLQVNGTGAPLPQVNGTAAPPVYDPANGHWYQEVQGPALTWAQARDAAAALSYAGLPGHLATVTSAEEDQFILNNVPNAQSGSTHWIGGYQDRSAPDYSEPAGGWRWVTGEKWDYTNWRGGEPNNAGGVEDFLEMKNDGTWNDLSGTATLGGYLIEYEAPSPSAAPSNLTATLVSPSQVNLAWTDNSGDETGFEIQRQGPSSDWVSLATAPAGATSFADGALTVFGHYSYRVRALGPNGPSDWSNTAGIDAGPGAAVTLDAMSHDFGAVVVGATSAPATITLTNKATTPLTINGVTLSGAAPGDFAITSGGAGITVGPGASLPVTLTFTPAGPGSRSALLVIADSAPGSPHQVTLTGTGIAPLMRVSPVALDFSRVPVGLNGTLAVLVQNTGSAPFTVGSIQFQGANAGDFSLATDGVSGQPLGPGDIALLNIRFSPSATGPRSATLLIPDDVDGTPRLVPLTGAGTDPLLMLNSDSLLFPVQPGTSSTQTLVITNGGVGPLELGGFTMAGPNAGSFQIVSDSGQNSLNPGESRTVQISFSATTVTPAAATASARRHGAAAGARPWWTPAAAHIAGASYSATLQIKHNDPHPGSPHSVALTAVTAGPAAPLPPAAPTGLAATLIPVLNGARAQVSLTWTNHSTNEKALAIWRQTGAGVWQRVGVVIPHTTSFADRSVSPGVTYTYRMRATTDTLASDWSNLVTVTLPAAPAAPTGLAAQAASAGEIDLTWTSHSNNERAFAIWRKQGTQDWQRVGVVPPGTTRFADRGLAEKTSYRYRVRATTDQLASDWSNEASATTPEAPPAAPTGLKATVVSASEIDLTWTSGKGNELGIAIFRRAGSGDWQRIGVAPPWATSYRDRSVKPGVSYQYVARSHNDRFVSAWSNQVGVSTPAAP